MNTLYTIAHSFFLNLLSPPYCAHCKIWLTEREPLCKDCFGRIKRTVSSKIIVSPTHSITTYTLSDYHEPIRSLITAKRFGKQSASHQLATLLIQADIMPPQLPDLLVPIPLHWSRYASRGFNQAEIIAQRLGQHYRIPVLPLIKRHRSTNFQSDIPITQRTANVDNCFAINTSCNFSTISKKHIMFIDDLITTGATLRSAASTISTLNPSSLSALAAARVCM
jgi:ComF family protein